MWTCLPYFPLQCISHATYLTRATQLEDQQDALPGGQYKAIIIAGWPTELLTEILKSLWTSNAVMNMKKKRLLRLLGQDSKIETNKKPTRSTIFLNSVNLPLPTSNSKPGLRPCRDAHQFSKTLVPCWFSLPCLVSEGTEYYTWGPNKDS